MPYKREGKNVMHFKNGSWSIKQRCSSVADAESALRLLNGIENNPEFEKQVRVRAKKGK